jgi:hypothetical protein
VIRISVMVNVVIFFTISLSSVFYDLSLSLLCLSSSAVDMLAAGLSYKTNKVRVFE